MPPIRASLRLSIQDAFNQQTPEDKAGAVCMACCTFTQYVHEKRPDLRLARLHTDVCDSCFGFSSITKNPSSPQEEKDDTQEELDFHNEASVRNECIDDV